MTLPLLVKRALSHPLPGKLGPNLILDPGLFLVADPAGFQGKNQSDLALLRENHIGIAVHDFETRHVAHRALEAGILIAAHDQRVQAVALHGLAKVTVAALDFGWRGHGKFTFFDPRAQTTNLT